MTTDYDYIFAGGGAAALSLAYQMNQTPLRNKKILIIEQDTKDSNDRTWSFWTKQKTPFDAIVYKEWKKLEVVCDTKRLVFPVKELSYKMIRGIDFYKEVGEKLTANRNIRFLQQVVQEIKDEGSYAKVVADGQEYTAQYVFNSCFTPKIFSPYHPKYHFLLQHFLGMVIKTPVPCFDEQKVTLFDFRVAQDDGVHFFYILPFSSDTALIEYTVFSKALLKAHIYEENLENYISETLKIGKYEVLHNEWGVIPMTDYNFQRKTDKRIMNIGTLGGQSKASTGYTFVRIQQDSEHIVNSLLQKNTPFHRQKSPKRFQIYDSIILNIMHRKGESIKEIFMQLFEKNGMEKVLSFLDEKTTFWEDLQIMASVPPAPFLKSIQNIFFNRNIRKS